MPISTLFPITTLFHETQNVQNDVTKNIFFKLEKMMHQHDMKAKDEDEQGKCLIDEVAFAVRAAC